MTLLPEDFQPGENDVICGRGKKCYNHIGNERFRVHVIGMLDEYSRAKSKLDKSGVLSTVVAQIRAKSPNGGFVKQDEQKRWFEVGDFLAKEKTSQAFRDALHERYKSSNVSKKKRRQEETRASDRFRGITRSYSDGPGIEWLSLSSRGDMSMNSSRANMYQTASMNVLARLNHLGDLHTTTQSNRPQAPIRSHSSLGFSTGIFRDTLGMNSNSLSGGSIQNDLYASGVQFSNGRMHQAHASSIPPSPMMYATIRSSEMGSQEPLDAYRNSSAQSDLEMFDIISPPNKSGNFVSRSLTEQMHHSMPDLTRSSWDPMDLQKDTSGHNSAPDLNYCNDDDDSLGDVQLDPIPLEEFTPRPASPKKTVGEEDFKKPISMTLSPTSPSVAVSADLLACLEKFNGSAITDNNPFEPLPIAADGAMDDEKINRMVRQSAFDQLKPPLA